MAKTVLYYHVGTSPFVDKDIAILQQEYTVRVHHFLTKSKGRLLKDFIKQFFVLLVHSKKRTIVVSQFGGFHTVLPSFFSRITRLQSVIVLGGTDCVSFPSISYGNFARLLHGKTTCYSLRHADLLLPVHESLIHYKYTYNDDDFPSQGYLAHCKRVTTPAVVIYNGYDSSIWKSENENREQNSFVTVASGFGHRFGVSLKGLDLIIAASRLHPKSQFYIIGGSGVNVENKPTNLHLLDKIPNELLNKYLQGNLFYLQLSMSEGFPNALCEAMLSGCIPIVSNVGAMPSIIAESGFILKRKSIEELSAIIHSTYSLSTEELKNRSLNARHQIKDRFPLSLRNNQLLEAIATIKK